MSGMQSYATKLVMLAEQASSSMRDAAESKRLLDMVAAASPRLDLCLMLPHRVPHNHEVSSTTFQWRVIFNPGVRVRAAAEADALVVGHLREGELVRASNVGSGWLRLTSGFVLRETRCNGALIELLRLEDIAIAAEPADSQSAMSDRLDGGALRTLCRKTLCSMDGDTSIGGGGRNLPRPASARITSEHDEAQSIFPSHPLPVPADIFDQILQLLPDPDLALFAPSVDDSRDITEASKPSRGVAVVYCCQVCRSWRLAARRLLGNARYLSTRLPLRTLLEARCSAEATQV